MSEKHWLYQVANENNTTLYQMAKSGNISESTLYKMIARNTLFKNITINTMVKIAKSINLTSYEFVDKYNKYIETS